MKKKSQEQIDNEELAAKITAYWAVRGRRVNAQAYEILPGSRPVWGVKSDMKNGMPRG